MKYGQFFTPTDIDTLLQGNAKVISAIQRLPKPQRVIESEFPDLFESVATAPAHATASTFYHAHIALNDADSYPSLR